MKNSITSFTGKYQLSKTLRFELIPQGKTLEHIQSKGIIAKDQQRAKSYEKMKETIDAFHKNFIEQALSEVKLTRLEDFKEFYFASLEKKKDDKFVIEFEKVKEFLRKEIVKGFSSGRHKEIFGSLDKKELITEYLESWIAKQNGEAHYFDAEFKTFTTYFSGFHQNRKNMYTAEPQSTAIAYRLIHENLPKFLDNIRVFDKLKENESFNDKIGVLFREIEEYLNVNSINELFELNYFNEVLTQTQIEVYNLVIGGRSEKEGKRKIQGLNEYINQYNQGIEDKNAKLPKLKQLYKQILSDRVKTSFLPDSFEDDEISTGSQKVLSAIKDYYSGQIIDFRESEGDNPSHLLSRIQEFFSNIQGYDLDKIYLRNDTKLTSIAQNVFGEYSVFTDAIDFHYRTQIYPKFEEEVSKAKENKREQLEKQRDKFIKQSHYSIGFLQAAVNTYIASLESSHDLKAKDYSNCIEHYFALFSRGPKSGSNSQFDNFTNIIEKAYASVKELLESSYPADRRLNQQQSEINSLKDFLDKLMDLVHFLKPLHLDKEFTLERDERFYTVFESYYEALELVIPLYNKVRNFATQKAYSVEKVKLNFENAQLLNGWDRNKETDYLTTLLVKDDLYYLAVMDKKHNKSFENLPSDGNGEFYAKMVYKLLPGPNKMLPKVFFSGKRISFFNPIEELLENYKKETHKKGEKFSLKDCHALIDFFKASIEKHEDWCKFGFDFSETNTYRDLSDFYREVSQQGYKVEFERISVNYINQLVNEGKLYLFQIYNKDFSSFSKGRPNLHTMYWKALFDRNNLKDVVYKLNGEGEIFFRKSSIDKSNQITHPANSPIKNKNPRNPKSESLFDYELIKNKRFSIDKFQFHVPITLNFKAEGTNRINQDVLKFLRNNPDVNIIGLDRGERHLIYLTLINQQGQILKQFTLNEIINSYKNDFGQRVEVVTPYHDLLATKEQDRAKARENWSTIETIKELKEGYISQVVHVIAKMMVEYNAIVVMEDLNLGFKRGRFKVEKQVYQKLEKMLIDKLNYLVFKDRSANEPGGIYKALQLTNKFEGFRDMGKQSGFLFYVPAWNTSKIDPTTGFVNFFETRYESIEKTRRFFEKFESIHFSSSDGYFEFHFDYNEFTTRADGTRTKWCVCTYGDRILTFRNPDKLNQWDSKVIGLTQEFEILFGKYGIIYGDQKDIREQLLAQSDKNFFSSLMHLFRLVVQMRNSISNSGVDYLISPVKDEKTGVFYDSRKVGIELPTDADANGAYHIAKKGLYWLNQIHAFEGDDWKKLKFDTTNKGWLLFAQQKGKI